jgi:hypothetical protein
MFMKSIARSGLYVINDIADLPREFALIKKHLALFQGDTYILKYCTASRGGTHTLRLKLNPLGSADDAIEMTFNAEGFTGKCSTNQTVNGIGRMFGAIDREKKIACNVHNEAAEMIVGHDPEEAGLIERMTSSIDVRGMIGFAAGAGAFAVTLALFWCAVKRCEKTRGYSILDMSDRF